MKAIALISGGLDSILSARLIQNMGIEVIPLNYEIPFCRASGKAARLVKDTLKLDLMSITLGEDFLEVIKNPRYGFGSNMNPCIDCKIFMLRRTKELMSGLGADFVVTGEVLGQRPMSQHRDALNNIAERSGLGGLLLRPLSAKLLSPAIPEEKGWVKTEELLNFSGRTRKPQIELAGRLGIKDYPNPAGGCLLTDPQFSKRLKEIIVHSELNMYNIELLKIGRHFRISPKTKLVVGRSEEENIRLEGLAREEDLVFLPRDIPGPTALGRGFFDEELIEYSSNITCTYCDLNGAQNAEINYYKVPGKTSIVLSARRIDKEKLPIV